LSVVLFLSLDLRMSAIFADNRLPNLLIGSLTMNGVSRKEAKEQL